MIQVMVLVMVLARVMKQVMVLVLQQLFELVAKLVVGYVQLQKSFEMKNNKNLKNYFKKIIYYNYLSLKIGSLSGSY
jgi:hypothetical protein